MEKRVLIDAMGDEVGDQVGLPFRSVIKGGRLEEASSRLCRMVTILPVLLQQRRGNRFKALFLCKQYPGLSLC
jgi:hypothetical protein